MKELDDKYKELLHKLKEASKPNNYFTLTLKINDIIIEERIFTAEKYSIETLSETRTHFMMNDLIREVIKTFSLKEEDVQEQEKKKQMEQLWNNKEQNKK